jgi:hypothetical protein
MVSPDLQALPLRQFLVTWSTVCQFLASVLAALIGIWGISQMNPVNAHKKGFFWVLFAAAIGLAALGCLQNAEQLQQADLDKRVAEQRAGRTVADLGLVKGDLNRITQNYADLKAAIDKLALAAHIDPNGSLGDIVQGIGEKLRKPNVSVKGNQNSTVIGNGQAAQRQTINAANGIGTIGGTLINPQVNNFAPPPANLTHTENVISQDGDKKIMEIHVSTDRSIPGAAIGFIFSGPINNSEAFFRAHQPKLIGASITQFQWYYSLQDTQTGTPIPNSSGVRVNAPAAFVPGQDLVITVETAKDTRIAKIGQFQ